MAIDTALRRSERASEPHYLHRSHVLHVLPGFGVGGIQVRLARVINSLGNRFHHTILSLNGDLSCADRLDEGDTALETARAEGNVLQRLFADSRRLAKIGPDLLATYNWGSIEWAMANRLLRRLRHIHFEDGFGPEEASRQIGRRAFLRRRALHNSEAVIVPSRTLEAIALNQWNLPPERVRYIPNGIELDDDFLLGREPLFDRRPNETVIGAVAPLRPEKNLARLIEACASLPATVRLVLAGDGPERPRLEAAARERGLGDRILFLGSVLDPRRALAGFDIFALSSDTEQMPLTVLEAMAAGLPVASTDVGDVKRMLAPENQPFVAARDDTAALAAALAQLAADPAQRAALGRANRAHVRSHFPWRRMVESYAALFEGRR